MTSMCMNAWSMAACRGWGTSSCTPMWSGAPSSRSCGISGRTGWTRAAFPKMLDHAVVDPSSGLLSAGVEQIGGFCAAMGLDYGKLDIIRDREDQRLYILDANTTPHYNLAGWTGVTRAWFLHTVEQVVQTFTEHFPARSVIPALRPTRG